MDKERIECEHGQLARQCEICELRRELAAKTADSDHFFQLSGRYLERANNAESEVEALNKRVKRWQNLAVANREVAEKNQAEAEALRKALATVGSFIPCATGGTFEKDPPDAITDALSRHLLELRSALSRARAEERERAAKIAKRMLHDLFTEDEIVAAIIGDAWVYAGKNVEDLLREMGFPELRKEPT